jgi:hypothetical protein
MPVVVDWRNMHGPMLSVHHLLGAVPHCPACALPDKASHRRKQPRTTTFLSLHPTLTCCAEVERAESSQASTLVSSRQVLLQSSPPFSCSVASVTGRQLTMLITQCMSSASTLPFSWKSCKGATSVKPIINRAWAHDAWVPPTARQQLC